MRHAAQRMAAKLRPRVMLSPRLARTASRAAEARGRQFQRVVGRRPAGRSRLERDLHEGNRRLDDACDVTLAGRVFEQYQGPWAETAHFGG